MSRRFALSTLVIGLVATAFASGCNAGGGDGTSALDSVPAGKGAFRTCASVQSGQLPEDWRAESVSAGPLSLYAFQPLDSIEPASFEEVAGRPGFYRPFKVVVIIRTGNSVTLAIPPHERDRLSLVYRKDSGGRTVARPEMKVSEGDWAVTFTACGSDEPETQFGGGGFVVAGARCADIDVLAADQAEPARISFPFGAAC